MTEYVKINYMNAHDAIRAANMLDTVSGIAYRRKKGWFIYDLRRYKLKITDTPEFVALGMGKMPIPLSDEAAEILSKLIVSAKVAA
jgi:hypothetical protein